MSLAIRAATDRDSETIADFNQQLALESEHVVLSPKTVLEGVQRGLSRPDLCRYFVAELENRIVGQSMITFEWTDWRNGVIWWLQSVYVAPSHRRQGIFTALFRHIEGSAHSDPDVRALRLYVHHDNVRAIRTYEQLGLPLSAYRVCESDWSGATTRSL